ncbi:MAG: hypothetical protein M5U08_02020 [Burkholderiales bacterium]|nr:hypothetical protein [Burkholderiales bacterium]
MAVGRALGNELRSDGAAGAGPVLDHHARAHLVAELLRHAARQGVGRTARRERHDEVDRFARVLLRGHRRHERDGQQCGAEPGEPACPDPVAVRCHLLLLSRERLLTAVGSPIGVGPAPRYTAAGARCAIACPLTIPAAATR